MLYVAVWYVSIRPFVMRAKEELLVFALQMQCAVSEVGNKCNVYGLGDPG